MLNNNVLGYKIILKICQTQLSSPVFIFGRTKFCVGLLYIRKKKGKKAIAEEDLLM